LAQKPVRKKMTETKTKYKSYKIQGRTVNLIPRKDGRFNLQIEGQRGAAGSTAIISLKESKELIERLLDFPVEEKQLNTSYDEDGILTVKEYNSLADDVESTPTYQSELILEDLPSDSKVPLFMDINGVKNPKPEITINESIDYETGESIISFEGAGFSLRYDPQEIEPFKRNMEGKTTLEYDNSILDTEVDFADPEVAGKVSEELGIKNRKPKLGEILEATKKGKIGDTATKMGAKIQEAGLVANGAANLIIDWATDTVVENNLREINKALQEIDAAARKDILLGKPIGFINEHGPMLVARKISASYARSKNERQLQLGNKRADYLKFAEKTNQRALLKYNAPVVAKLKQEKLAPIQQEYNTLVEEVETANAKRNELNSSIKKIKESPWMKMTDNQIAVQKRRAAKEKNTSELSRINRIEREREQLKVQYETLRKEYDRIPSPAELRTKINTIVMKKKAIEAEIQRAASQRPEGYKDPISTDNRYGQGKITALFGQRLHTVILNARTEREKTKYNRGIYLRA
jgi:hypothetical protein